MAGARGVRKSPTVSAPQFKEGLPDISAFPMGSSACLECHVDGYPKPEVKWEKDGKAVMKSRNIHMMRSGERCMLQIKNLQEKDLGRYECIAINMIGTAISKSYIRFIDSITSEIADKKIPTDLKSSFRLQVPKHVSARSRSSERKSRRRSPYNWRSSSVSVNSRMSDVSSKGSFVEESNIFERLSRVNKGPKTNIEQSLKNTISKTNSKNEEHDENSNMKQSLANRFIAKIKIPSIFKQQVNCMHGDLQQNVRGIYPASRIITQPHETKHALQSSISSIKRLNGIVQSPDSQINRIPQSPDSQIDRIPQSQKPEMNIMAQSRKSELNKTAQSQKTELSRIVQPQKYERNRIVPPQEPEINIITQAQKPKLSRIIQPQKSELSRIIQPQKYEGNKIGQSQEPEINRTVQSQKPEINIIMQSQKPEEINQTAQSCKSELSRIVQPQKHEGNRIVQSEEPTIIVQYEKPEFNGTVQVQKPEMNGIVHASKRSIMNTWSKLTQRRNVPLRKNVAPEKVVPLKTDGPPQKVVLLKTNVQPGKDVLPKKDMPPKADLPIKSSSAQLVQQQDSVLEHRKCNQLSHLRNKDVKHPVNSKAKTAQIIRDFQNSVDDSYHKQTSPIESFAKNVQLGYSKNGIVNDHVHFLTNRAIPKIRNCEIPTKNISTETKIPTRKKDPNLERITSSLDIIYKIAENMLLDIGVFPNLTTKLIKDCVKTSVDQTSESRVDGSEARFDESQPRLDESQPRLDESQPRLDERKSRLDERKSRLDESQPRLDESQPRLDESQPRLDESPPRLDESQPRLDESQPRLDECQPRLDECQPRLDECQPRLDESQHKLNESQHRLDESPVRLDESPSGLVDSQDGLDKKQDRSDESLTGLDENLAGLDENLAGLAESLARFDDSQYGLDESKTNFDEKQIGLDSDFDENQACLTEDAIISDSMFESNNRTSERYSDDHPVIRLFGKGSSAGSGSDIKGKCKQQSEDEILERQENLKKRQIPRICIQKSPHEDYLKVHRIEGGEEEDEENYDDNCDAVIKEFDLSPFPDGRKCCAGDIRYLTAAIEEECENLTSSPMTPETIGNLDQVEDFLARRGQVETEFQKVTLPDGTPARIARGPQSVTVLRGESVTLAIHFAGVPTPDVIWIKGGTTLTDGGRNSILVGKDMSVLTVSNVTADDSGKYVVCVENEGGGDSCFASVAVVGFPEPPGGEPNASDFTDHSLVLSWYGSMYDGGSVVTGYVVEMCLAPDRNWQRVASCENTSYVVQGLSCGQRYIFRVRAENKYGVSHPSRESQTICLDDYLGEKMLMRDEIVEFEGEPVVIEVGSQFAEQYEMKEEVGKGRFGTVYRCIEVSTGRPRAAKVIRCIKMKDKEKVRQEVDIMNCLHHPKLLKILAAFESGRNMIMITEYISGGELFERVIADDFILTESDCVLFMRQICDGVAYMHRNSIIHLDLKPENILCQTKTSHQIKIIDFGLARVYDEKENLRILFGTPEFVAPEVISYEPVGPASDMWSVGVICYVLLSGLSPFMGDTDSETFANITRGEIDFDEEAFLTISQDAKTFISALLIKKPNKRLSANECLKHTWLERATSWIQSKDHPISTAKLKKFIIRRKWQKSGTAIRALGRMVSLSRSSAGSSCESTSPAASPTCSRSRSLVSSRSETNESGDSEVFPDTESVDLSR